MPPTPIRIVVDITGRETELDAAARARLEPTDTAWLEAPQVTQVLADLVEQSTRLARQRSSEVAAGARDRMHAELVPVAERLTQLALVNPSVSQAELDAAREELASLDDGLARVRVRLDALRLIIVAPA